MSKYTLIAVLCLVCFWICVSDAAAQEVDDVTAEDQSENGQAQDLEEQNQFLAEDDDTDEGSNEESNDAVEQGILTIESKVGTQSVVNGSIPLYVRVDPTIDSSKAKITWDIPRGLEVSGSQEKWFRMEDGVPQTFSLKVTPLRSGRYEIVVDVTAWRYDTNYVTSDVLSFEVDDDLHVTPISSEYNRNRIMYNLFLFVIAILLIIGGMFGVKFGIKRFKQWMAED